MKKTAIALTLTSLLTLPLVVSSDAWAAPVRSLQKEQNYEQFISKRQVVDQLLADAARIFHSPARVSDAGFTAKMPSNMEAASHREMPFAVMMHFLVGGVGSHIFI